MSKNCANTSAGKQKRTTRNIKVTPFPSPRYAGMVNAKAKARIERSVDHHQIGTIETPQKVHSTRY